MLKKRTGIGPAAQKMLDIAEGRRAPGPEQQALIDKQHAEIDASLTAADRALLKELDDQEAFSQKYVLRSEYDYRIKKVRSEARWELNTYLVLLVIIPLIALLVAVWPRH
jgi:hypothetical protein